MCHRTCIFVPVFVSFCIAIEKSSDSKSDPAQAVNGPLIAFCDHDAEGKYGFVNQCGEVVIKPQFAIASDFVRGCAFVMVDRRFCCLGEKGNIKFKLPENTSRVGHLSEGLVWFQVGREWGLCNEKGDIVIEPKYHWVEPFAEGLACVNIEAKSGLGPPIDGNWGFIDKTGAVVIPIKHQFGYSFSEGLARVIDNHRTRFLDKSGNVAIDLGANSVRDFREGLAPVTVWPETRKPDELTRYIDRNNKTMLTIEGRGYEFHEGIALYDRNPWDKKLDSSSYGYIDRNGHQVIPTMFADGRQFSDGLAAARIKKSNTTVEDALWGYLDKTGRFVIAPQFTDVDEFHNGVAKVHVGGKFVVADDMSWWEGGEWWLIDKSGKRIKRLWKDRK